MDNSKKCILLRLAITVYSSVLGSAFF